MDSAAKRILLALWLVVLGVAAASASIPRGSENRLAQLSPRTLMGPSCRVSQMATTPLENRVWVFLADPSGRNRENQGPRGTIATGYNLRRIENASGRAVFLCKDPLGFVDGPNLYSYVVDNPWTKFDPEGLNATWGGDNWFANWILPDPVAEWHAADAGAKALFGTGSSGVERTSGGLDLVGHGIMVVAAMIPGEAAVERGLEKGAVTLTEKIFEKQATNIERNLVENTAKNTTEKSAQKVEQLAKNAQNGKQFEQQTENALKETDKNVQSQVTIQPNNGAPKVKADHISTDSVTDKIKLTESKSSATAPFTKNQKTGYPAIGEHGGTILGKGKPGYPGGTQIPPTKVNIVRPPEPPPQS